MRALIKRDRKQAGEKTKKECIQANRKVKKKLSQCRELCFGQKQLPSFLEQCLARGSGWPGSKAQVDNVSTGFRPPAPRQMLAHHQPWSAAVPFPVVNEFKAYPVNWLKKTLMENKKTALRK